MKKWLIITFAVVVALATLYWFNLNKSVRFLILNQPETANVLLWTTAQRDAAFRAIEDIKIQPFSVIDNGSATLTFEKQPLLTIDDAQLDTYFEQQRIAGLVVLQGGKLRIEKYGLDFDANGKWTSFSVAKSFTSILVGAAIKDGYITSLDDKVSDYIVNLKGSVYQDVSIQQLLTMTSGVKWNEDYEDPNSDVSLFNSHEPEENIDATVSYMRTLSRANEPGSTWLYSTGETNLIGVLISQATGKTLSEYLTEKVWTLIGAEKPASWVLSKTGHEISGCCIQATTKDFARFGQFILEGAKVNNNSILPDGYLANATSNQVDFDNSIRGYGYQWWTSKDGIFQARGIFGQGIFIDPSRKLIIALNSNWPSASDRDLIAARDQMYRDIQMAVDLETNL